jgi:hypothetical protein
LVGLEKKEKKELKEMTNLDIQVSQAGLALQEEEAQKAKEEISEKKVIKTIAFKYLNEIYAISTSI